MGIKMDLSTVEGVIQAGVIQVPGEFFPDEANYNPDDMVRVSVMRKSESRPGLDVTENRECVLVRDCNGYKIDVHIDFCFEVPVPLLQKQYTDEERNRLDELLGMPNGADITLTSTELAEIRSITGFMRAPGAIIRLLGAFMLCALETREGVDSAEKALISALYEYHVIPTKNAHVEYGCLEHEIAQVCYLIGPPSSDKFFYVGLCPKTGKIIRY
jgi:hypothetical protein